MGFQIGFPALRNYPPVVGGGVYDTDAQAMFDKRLAESDEPTAAYKQAISDYVTAIKAVPGFWDDIIQLVVMAGATTVNGARQSIKGLDLINDNVDDADIGIKTGATGNGSNESFRTGYFVTDFPTNDFHTYAYFTAAATISISSYYGAEGTTNNPWLMRRNSGNVLFRCYSNTSDQLTQAAVAGPYGMSRGNSSNFDYLIPSGSGNITRASAAPPVARTIRILATTANNSDLASNWSDGRFLVWALGNHTTLTDYNTPTDNLITALNAI